MSTEQSTTEQIHIAQSPTGWTLSGELDAGTAGQLAAALEDIPDMTDGRIEVDLAEVTFIDSTGLRVLLGLADRVAASGQTVVVRNPSKVVIRLLAITKLGSVFGLDSVEREAK